MKKKLNFIFFILFSGSTVVLNGCHADEKKKQVKDCMLGCENLFQETEDFQDQQLCKSQCKTIPTFKAGNAFASGYSTRSLDGNGGGTIIRTTEMGPYMPHNIDARKNEANSTNSTASQVQEIIKYVPAICNLIYTMAEFSH